MANGEDRKFHCSLQPKVDPERRRKCLPLFEEAEEEMANLSSGWRSVMAREWSFGLLLVGLCLFPVAEVVFAQAVKPVRALEPGTRLLSRAEGRELAGIALEAQQEGVEASDCSHLVNRTYQNAGYDYPYSSSFELYAGQENFARVRYPQAGDLVVWPGHVGIVMVPSEHSFFSLVSTGMEVQDYDSSYWRSRGKPRFYRYKVDASAGAMEGKVAQPPPRTRTATSQEPASDKLPDQNRPPKNASEKVKLSEVYEPPVAPAVAAERTSFDIPPSIVIAEGVKQPTSSQVAEAISELSSATGVVLRQDDPLKQTMPVIIFERLRVEKLEIKKDHGWAKLEMDERATIAAGQANYKRHKEKIRWELRRTESGWQAVTPNDKTYVPNDVAVRNLAAQLARLTESDGPNAHLDATVRQESQIANLLSALLENKKQDQ